ncbi:Unannotated [Lentimonas sp. CC19]|nr:Unannotated [Lentimonas sp. CC10]CAA6691922.1 Unannotated [Lentimonas sp. CC19]CAA7072175.1 Unannotated [Lentimonas sp. CC11]
MLTCKQISKILSKEDYDKLSPLRKLWVKFHVKCCLFCGKFNRQVMESHEMCRCYKDREHTLEPSRPKLDEDKKAQLKAMLAEQSKLHAIDSGTDETGSQTKS